MNTLGSLECHRRVIFTPGTYDLDISDMDFSSEDDYEAWILCGHAWIPCNDKTTSPETNFKTATSLRVVVVDNGPATVGIFPLIGKTKTAAS